MAANTSPKYHLVVWRDRRHEWRWTVRARNGQIVAVSGEGYARRADARGMARKVLGVSVAGRG